MENKEPTQSSKPVTEKKPKTSVEKPQALLKKLKPGDKIPNKERVLRTYQVISDWYQLSEEFLNDEVNQTLLLGASQKLSESTDPIYKRRIKKYIKTLVAPTMGKARFDASEIFGKGGSRGSLDTEAQEKYLDQVTDKEATEEFIKKYQTQIEESKKEWARRGYELDINTRIVSDSALNFKSKTGGTGFINVPEIKKGSKQNVTFVLLKGVSDKDEFVRHELYHIKDYFDFIRRGKDGSILEGLDELHTEYSAQNYSKTKRDGSSYFVLKEFWNKLSHMGEVDFDLIKDRTQAVEKITEIFGVDGMTIFSLQDAQSSGSFATSEIFYKNPERTITEMLISKGKVELKKVSEPGVLEEELQKLIRGVEEFTIISSPNEKTSLRPMYASIYDFMTTDSENVYINQATSPEKAREITESYTRALAFAELYQLGEIKIGKEQYQQLIDMLGKVPHRRKKVEFEVNKSINETIERKLEYNRNEGEVIKETYLSLYYGLTKDFNGVDFAFSLQNPETKKQILSPFLAEVGVLANHCLNKETPEFRKWFIEGFYSYSVTPELREYSLNYLKENFPELTGLIDEVIEKTDVRKLKTVSI